MGQSKQSVRGGYTRTCDPKLAEAQRHAGDLPPLPGRPEASGRAFLGYRRCLEYDPADGEGQDSAWMYVDHCRVIGVLADGVSQSFYGQIAARHIVAGMAHYLIDRDSFDKTPACESSLRAELRQIAQCAIEEVQSQELRPGLSKVMVDVLEEERQKGSQAVFGAFVYYRDTRRLVTCQLGDVRIRIFDGNQPGKLLPYSKNGRFSTTATSDPDDILLEKCLRFDAYDNITGVIVHSDGVDDSWGERPSLLGDNDQGALLAALNTWARKDDVSLVSVMTMPVLKWCAGNPTPAIDSRSEAPTDSTTGAAGIGRWGQPPPIESEPDPYEFEPGEHVDRETITQSAPLSPWGDTNTKPSKGRYLDTEPTRTGKHTSLPRTGNRSVANQNQKLAMMAVAAVVLMGVSFGAGHHSAGPATATSGHKDQSSKQSEKPTDHPSEVSADTIKSIDKWRVKIDSLRSKTLVRTPASSQREKMTWHQIQDVLKDIETQMDAVTGNTAGKPAANGAAEAAAKSSRKGVTQTPATADSPPVDGQDQ